MHTYYHHFHFVGTLRHTTNRHPTLTKENITNITAVPDKYVPTTASAGSPNAFVSGGKEKTTNMLYIHVNALLIPIAFDLISSGKDSLAITKNNGPGPISKKKMYDIIPINVKLPIAVWPKGREANTIPINSNATDIPESATSMSTRLPTRSIRMNDTNTLSKFHVPIHKNVTNKKFVKESLSICGPYNTTALIPVSC